MLNYVLYDMYVMVMGTTRVVENYSSRGCLCNLKVQILLRGVVVPCGGVDNKVLQLHTTNV